MQWLLEHLETVFTSLLGVGGLAAGGLGLWGRRVDKKRAETDRERARIELEGAKEEVKAAAIERDTAIAPELLAKVHQLEAKSARYEQLHAEAKDEHQKCREGLELERSQRALVQEHVAVVAEKALAARGGEDDTLTRIIVQMRGAGPESVDALRVLVVDDDEHARRAIARMVTRLGHRALEASSAFDALDVIRMQRVDVVLTDVIMPGFSGLELLAALRRAKQRLAVVLMSGDAQTQLVMPPDLDLLTKPFEAAALGAALERARAGGAVHESR